LHETCDLILAIGQWLCVLDLCQRAQSAQADVMAKQLFESQPLLAGMCTGNHGLDVCIGGWPVKVQHGMCQFGQAERAFNSALQTNSRNAQARFALIEGRLGTLSEDLAESVRGALPASAAAVVRGWRLGATGDWRALAALEPDLAQAAVTDAWYPEAAWLRALWRSNVTEDRERQASDALRLIDRALVLDSDPRLYTLRALSAVALGDPHYIIESFRFAAATMRVRLGSAAMLQAAEREVMQRNLSRMADRLQGDVAEAAPQRAAKLLRDIEALIERLAQASGP